MKATKVMMNLGSAGTPQAGAGAKLSSSVKQATAAKSAQTKTGADSFERTLDDAQASRAQEPKAKAETKNTDKTAAKADNKEVKDDVKDTPKDTAKDTKSAEDAAKAAAEAAASEGAKDTPKTEGKGDADKAGKDSDVKEDAGKQTTETVKATTLDAMLASLAGAASAVGENTADVEGAAPVVEEEQPQLGQTAMKLENLLPQTEEGAEQAAQNGKLMDMLNSVQTPVTTLKAAPELTELAKQALAAQQNTENNAAADTPAVIVQPGTAAALGNAAAAAENEAAQQTAQQGAFAAALSAQTAPAVDKAEAKTQSVAESLFGAAQVVVEAKISLPNTNNSAQQQLQDFLKRQGQPQQQNETEDGSAVIKQGRQLPENADFDVATVTKEQVPQQPLAGAQNIINTMGVQQTAAAQQPDAAQQVRDPYNVMQQIVDQAKLIRSGENTEMVIQLNPKHLGELTLRVSVSTNGAVNASFHTDNPTVRGLIESSMVQLKQELQAQGIKVNNVEVYSGLSQDFFAGSQPGQQSFGQGASQNAQSGSLRAAAFEEDAEALSVTAAAQTVTGENTPSIGTANGVDYKV